MSQHQILLVDDEPHVLRVLRLSLERVGYKVATANDGNSALLEISKCRPDVLITDINMAGMSGRTLCPLVRQVYPEDLFLILVMTSMTAAEERVWVQQLQNIEFLEKPLSPRQLIARLFLHFAGTQ